MNLDFCERFEHVSSKNTRKVKSVLQDGTVWERDVLILKERPLKERIKILEDAPKY